MAQTKPLSLEQRQKAFDKQAAQSCGPDALLILKEKHGDIYFAIPTLEVLYEVALAVVEARYKDGWYEGSVTQPPEQYDMTLAEIDAIKSDKIRAATLEDYNCHKRALEQWKYEQAERDAIVDAIKTKNGRCAWRVLRDHNEWEYEGWNILHLSTAKDYLRGGL